MLCRVLTDCSKKEPFSLQGSKDAYVGWEACCYLQSIPQHVTALLCHGGVGQRQTSLDTFSALFTATNLDTRATEPLDDMPATEEASESPAEEDRLRFHLHRERMQSYEGKRGNKYSRGQMPPSCTLIGGIKGKVRGRADSSAQRGDG